MQHNVTSPSKCSRRNTRTRLVYGRCTPFGLAALATLCLATPLTAFGQTDPSNFETVINVPPDVAPDSIGSSTQLNLGDGGEIGSNLVAGAIDGSSTNIEVNIGGGTISGDLVASAAVVNISGGTVGDFSARSGSIFNISGGTLGESFTSVDSGSEVHISGGLIDTTFWVNSATVDIAGGTLYGGDHGIRARSGSEIYVSGGTIGPDFGAQGGRVRLEGGTVGAEFRASSRDVELVGGEFKLNGVDYTEPNVSLADEDVFTGTLADGSVFIFSPQASDTLSDVLLTAASLPSLDKTPIVVDPLSPVGPAGLRAGQSLTLRDGGALGENFAVVDAALTIEGGTVGRGIEVYGGAVNMSGGTAGAGRPGSFNFNAYSGSDVSISGGSVVGHFNAFSDSEVEISGGTLEGGFTASSGSAVRIRGGSIRDDSRALGGSTVEISGGVIGPNLVAEPNSRLTLSGGTVGVEFVAGSGSNVELIGGEFMLNGAEFTDSSISLDAGDVFTGTLADGSVFVFSDAARDYLADVSVTETPLPELNTTPIVVDSSNPAGPAGLRSGQSLALHGGGELGDNFAVVDATLTIGGGTVGEGMEIDRGVVHITGGAVEGGFAAYADSVAVITGGDVGTISAERGSTINIQGGEVEGFHASSDSIVNIRGGELGDDLLANSGSEVNFFGTQFTLDGLPLDSLNVNEPFVISDRDVTLSGILADGSPLSVYLNVRSTRIPKFFGNARVTVTMVNPVPEPGSLILLGTGGFALVRRTRRRRRTLRSRNQPITR